MFTDSKGKKAKATVPKVGITGAFGERRGEPVTRWATAEGLAEMIRCLPTLLEALDDAGHGLSESDVDAVVRSLGYEV